MVSVRTCEVGEFEFIMFFATGSHLEDGIVIPHGQELTPEFLRALEVARKAYKYKQAEILLTVDGGYWLEGHDVKQVIATIQEGLECGFLLPNAKTEHEIRMLTDTRYRGEKLKQYREEDKTTKKRRVQQSGYVYLIKSTEGYYKIGRSKKLQERITTLGVQLPFDIELVHNIHSDDYTQLEIELHELFEPKRIRGEWFALSPDDIEYIKGL